MANYSPREPTDRENAPLLRDPDNDDESIQEPQSSYKSFKDYLSGLVEEPLTPLSKFLLVLAFILLILSSIFIGLFAGAQHKLNAGKGGDNTGGGDKETKPTITATSTLTLHPTTTAQVPLPEPTNPSDNVCNSPECVVLAAGILESLDTSQDPCENFYKFSNGGWLKSHEIPAGRSGFGQFDLVSRQNKAVIRGILRPEPSDTITTLHGTSTAAAPTPDEQTLTKLRGLYDSCMNEELLDKRGSTPLLEFAGVLRQLYNGETSENTKDFMAGGSTAERKRQGLTAAIAFLHSRGIGGLFSFDIDGDAGVDPNFMVPIFSQPELGLPSKEYYEEPSITDLYQTTLTRFLIALDDTAELMHMEEGKSGGKTASIWPPWPWPPWGEDDDDKDGGHDGGGGKKENRTERVERLAKGILTFEKKIANASLDLEELFQDPIGTYNPISFSEFESSLPEIHIPSYIASFTPRNFPTRVIVTSTTYASSLSSILASTDSEIVEGYLVTRVAQTLAPFLGMSSEIWKANRELDEVLQGIKKGQVPDRSDWCAQQVEDTMGFAAGRFFVQEVFGGESKAKGTKVITDIIDTFKESLKHISWMDEKSATAAAEKADAIRVKVGYPISPNTESAISILRYYNLVQIDENTFFENYLSTAASDVYKKWQMLGKRRDLDSWEMYPSMVNAYFNPPANEIVFPAGILRPPFFSQEWPAYLAYGAFGAVAAHELTHAFDSAGRLYNQQGKLEQWWTNATSDAFNVRQACLAKQFAEYYVDDGKGGKVYVNGNLTSGENIGDSGVIQAFRAWKAQFSASLAAGNEFKLPGLNFTQEQLFFIGFGQIWANHMKPEAAVKRVRTDPHSPAQFRVEGTLYNVPEFAAAFHCRPNARLNPPPEKQCRFW